MKAKLLLLVLTVVLAFALAGGATMAWFTDTATNAGNTFTAGTVDIYAHRTLGDPIPGPMFYTTVAEGTVVPGQPPHNSTGLWWPGRMVARNLSVRNPGSLQVRLHQVSAEITSINGAPPTANPALAASFAAKMHVKIYVAGHPHTRNLLNGFPDNLQVSDDTILHQFILFKRSLIHTSLVSLNLPDGIENVSKVNFRHP